MATPDLVVVEDGRGRWLTAAALARDAEVVAAGLQEQGVKPGSAVSWQLPTTIESVVLLCALARLGAVQNPIVPILRRREVGFITSETGAELLITAGTWRSFDYSAMAQDVAAATGCAALAFDDGGLPSGDVRALPPPPSADGAARFAYYSSGTTAEPKGGRHTDASVMASANGLVAHMGIRGDDCIPIPFPFTHIGGIGFLVSALHTGCRLLLIEVWDPDESPALIGARGGTLLGITVPFFRAYLDAQRRYGTEPLFPRLRAFIGGGAPKPPEVHAELRDVFGVPGIVSGWGLTEFPIATCSSFDDSDEDLATTEGRPSPGVEVRVAGHDGRDLPAGEEGELLVRGPQMVAGYVDRRLDNDAFDARGYLRTGDLGVVGPRGHVRITGRLKDVIIRNAENISVQEVEDVLYEHPKVADVAVIGLPDTRTGERACAVVVLRPGEGALTLAEVAAHCRARGVAMQKVPEQLEFVDVLPRNLLGKVVKQELRVRYGAP